MINIFFKNLFWSFNVIEIYSLCLNKVRKNLAAVLDRSPLFANFSLSFVPFVQYAGWR